MILNHAFATVSYKSMAFKKAPSIEILSRVILYLVVVWDKKYRET